MKSSPKSADFVALWSAHSKEIYAYIYSLVFNGPDADDVFQETSLVLLQKFDDFQPGTNFPAWAFRVAYHKSLKLLGRRKSTVLIDETLMAILADEWRPNVDQIDNRIAALNLCLEQFPPRDRELIRLRYEGDQSIEEMARQMERSTSLIYKSLSRIHDLLLSCIRRRLAEGEPS
jgi:RNA polymerase sigma-70 factor (ECF subfamily)